MTGFEWDVEEDGVFDRTTTTLPRPAAPTDLTVQGIGTAGDAGTVRACLDGRPPTAFGSAASWSVRG
ncbi:hypothetical protein SAMN05660464_1199 [Geodermatophilus dictyosporus]|uniref:Uncharacterized protein n=1 Tax=Geodermatophilus dictyosporus TaxID=1523247 RepID=A0A1I5K1G1_9ACTN|nr:hypothetical protein SAMN05660464_1199 [Geodermatophilus dictyosporus]